MTDIVGSTAMTQSDPSGYGRALATHNDLAEATFARNKGKLLKSRGQGDGLLGEFESSADAVRAALEFQSELDRVLGSQIRCRFSVHFGVCYGDGEDYFGHTLNLCARLRDVGSPNQILVSATIQDLSKQLLNEGIEFFDLGWHGLKDISSATRIFQVDRKGQHQSFLRLKTDARFRVPSFGTPFVGRKDELERVAAILADRQAVLLLGPGGIGKTRLGVKSAEIVAAQLNCPCVFANLIEAVDAASVEQVLSETFGFRTLADVGKTTVQEIALIVDNCDHVAIAASEAINQLLDWHPQLKVIATSRTKMVINSCSVLNVDGLGVNDHGTASSELFVQLAKTHDDSFELRPGEDEIVRAICNAAEGIPLVIEIAAFYINSLSVQQIADRVYDLVRTSQGTGRHSSLDAVLSGTIQSLDQETKEACGSLSWFAGGFTLDAATKVLGSQADQSVRRLIETSLLRFDRNAVPTPRYRFLEVIRTFTRDTLGGDSPSPEFIQWSLERSLQITDKLGEDQSRQEMSVEISNFRVALASLSSGSDSNLDGLRLVTQLARYWTMVGAAEGSTFIQTMLTKNPEPKGDHETLILYANAYNRLGVIHYQQQNWVKAQQSYKEARKYADQAENYSISTSTKLNEGLVFTEQGLLDQARPLLTEAEEYYRLEGMTHNWLIALLNLGRLELRAGNLTVAEKLLTEGSSKDSEGHIFASALCNLNLISCALLSGKSPAQYVQAVDNQESVLNVHGKAALYYLKGLIAFADGDFNLESIYTQRAEQLLKEGATINEFELGLKSQIVMK